MDRLLCMQAFARAVETGSFSAVAREQNTGQPNVSRQIAALETHLGARLLHRSTRKLTLTPEGERYYAEARRVLDAIAEAESNARGKDVPRGLLRVACPVALARFKLLPLVGPFLARYPDLELDLRDSALKARRLATARRVCVASPAYLAARGIPQRPEHLRAHNCILYSLLATGAVWPFVDEPVTVRGNFRVNSPEGVRSAVLDGLGIGMAPSWLFDDALDDGRLTALLPDWPLPPLPIHALYPAQRLWSRRAAVFMDFVAEAFAQDAALSR